METKQTFDLHGFEKCFSCLPQRAISIVHVMHLEGNISVFFDDPYLALLKVVNRHPRMRARLCKNDCFTGTIHGPLEKDQVSKLLTINEDLNWYNHLLDGYDCVPTDRVSNFPFRLELLKEGKDSIRLILFSDHYMSDGFSGYVVLNEFIQNVLNPDADPKAEMPLQPSIYSKLKPRGIKKALLNIIYPVVKPLLLSVAISDSSKVRSHHDSIDPELFQQPLKPTTGQKYKFMRIADGTPENLNLSLARCREEKVTLHGAAVVAFAIALGVMKHGLEDLRKMKSLKLALDVDYNMRSRVREPNDPEAVGFNVAIGTLMSLESPGISLSSRFWEEARMAKRETDNYGHFFHQLIMKFIHKEIHAKASNKFLRKIAKIKSDGNLSNLGRYPFETDFKLKDGSSLSIKDIHMYNNPSFTGPNCILFLNSVKSIGYTLTSTLDPSDSEIVLNTVVKVMENLHKITREMTILDVLDLK